MDKPTRAGCCTDHESESGCRNNYFDGKRLTTDSFRVEQRYFLERRHLLNRAILGWGVVYGFKIESASGRLTIGPGLALDECGRELLQTGERELGFDDLITLDEKGASIARERIWTNGSGSQERICWLLSAHYAEKLSGAHQVEDSCKCEHEEFERTCETVRYSLRQVSCDQCCLGCKCELTCKCDSEKPCAEHAHEGEPRGRRVCRCVCEHLMNWQPGGDDCAVCEIDDPCGHVRVDLRNSVPLACVSVVRDARNCLTLGDTVDACGPRRLVMRNDVLFDLIRGCDLTRISEIGWKDWHRRKETEPVSFEEFSAAFGDKGYDQNEYVTHKFWVKFSRPVLRDTLRPDCFVIRAMSAEREGGWWDVLRVPITRIETADAQLVEKATIVVDGAWVEDGLRGRRSLFLKSDTWIEIEVRGDFIVDCNGQTVDANALGLSPGPTGNGTPGDTFISTFRVEATHPYKGASS
ncbi:MAG TPA: hypothetical protein VKB93_06375 [Thermoanaerobaculia bacterium]|nr:hypothetical protein [Thermoanaerobaculia bacterium]